MKLLSLRILVFSFCLCWFAGCDDPATGGPVTPGSDPVQEEVLTFRHATRQDYNNRRFDALEKIAAEIRAEKAVFRDGWWKLTHFYEALRCRVEEPDSMWQLHDQIHQEWMAAKPQSITARVAYADFLVEYAWQARGSGHADTVTTGGWQDFMVRLAFAGKVLEKAKELTDKDLFWWQVALKVALGQGLPKPEYDALVEKAHAFEPKYWNYDRARAYSLLPRWYGKPGDWEEYAGHAAARVDGLGAETYARIVIDLRGYHDNIFEETKASWPKTRGGLEQMREKYPDSLEIVSFTAALAALAKDRPLAKEMFDRLGDKYLRGPWHNPKEFAKLRNWAQKEKQ